MWNLWHQISFSQNCPRKHFCFDDAMFHLSIKGYCKTRPHRSYCFLSMFKLHCKRRYRNLATYIWCTTWREDVMKTAPARRRHSVGGGGGGAAAAAHSFSLGKKNLEFIHYERKLCFYTICFYLIIMLLHVLCLYMYILKKLCRIV